MKKDNRRRNYRGNGLEDLKYQADDILKKLDVSDIDSTGVSKEIKEKIENSTPEELERIEQQLGISGDIDVNQVIEESLQNGEEVLYAVQPVSDESEEEEYGDEEEESVDGTFSIEISEDKMTATITLIPSKGKGAPLNYESIKKAIEQRGIVYGVNYDMLQKLVESVEKNKEVKEGVIFAQGTPPEKGEDGKIEFHFSETEDVLFDNDEDEDNSEEMVS